MRQVYFGWYVVAIAMVSWAVVCGSSFASFGIFVHPVSKDLNLTRAEMNTALILMNLGNALLAPFVGPLLDRFSPRRAVIGGGVLFATFFIGLGLSRSILLSSVLLALVFPTAYLVACSISMTMLIARWFTVHRGRAMTLAGVGMSLGNVFVTLAMGFLVKTYEWRTALIIAGAAVGALVVVLGLVLRDRPGPGDVEPGLEKARRAADAGASATEPALTLREALRSPQLWLIVLSTALALGATQTVTISLIPMAQEIGVPLIKATGLMSVLGAFAIAGGLGLAVVADKLDRTVILSLLFLMVGAVNALLLARQDYGVLLVCAALLGVAAGTIAHMFYTLLADRFGTAIFGALRGLTLAVIAGVGMISIRFAGEVFDRTGEYDLMFIAFIGMTVTAAAVMFATRFTRSPLAAAAPAAG
jgi:MFS family permease